MNLDYSTSFIVMPDQCNYLYPMVFGGALWSELDKCAAAAVRRLLYASECDSAVTFKWEGTFHAAAECGDIVFIAAKVVDMRRNSVVVDITAHREKHATGEREAVATGKFVFVSKLRGKFHPHGLTMPAGKP